MDNSYNELKAITDYVYEEFDKTGIQIPFALDVIKLLDKYGFKLRQKDGKLKQINFSVPKSLSGLVVGLRYEKNDNTKTEDLFLFQKGAPIVSGYKGMLEKTLKEYKGTHKLQR